MPKEEDTEMESRLRSHSSISNEDGCMSGDARKRRRIEDEGPDFPQLWEQLLGLQQDGAEAELATVLGAVAKDVLQALRLSCKAGRNMANLVVTTVYARKPAADRPVPPLHIAVPSATAMEFSEPLSNEEIARIFSRNLPLLHRLRRVAFTAPTTDGDLSLSNLNTLCGAAGSLAGSLTSLQWLGAPPYQQPDALRAVAHISNLAELDMSGFSRLAGENLPTIASLTGLTRLALSRCRQLRDVHLAALAPLRCLRCLDLSFTHLDGSGLSALAPATALTQLDMAACERLSMEGLQAVSVALPAMSQLDLSWSKLQQGEVTALAGLGNLRQLALRNSVLMPKTVEALAALTGLSALDLSDSPVRGAVGRGGPKGLTPLSTLTGLVELDAEGGSAELSAFATLPHLTRLGLGLVGRLTADAPRYPSLRSLSLSSPALSDALLPRLAPMMPGLASLTLSYGEGVTDDGLRAIIGAAPQLRALSLRCMEALSDGAAMVLAGLPCLEELAMECNFKVTHSFLLATAHLPSIRRIEVIDCPGIRLREAQEAQRLVRPSVTIKWQGSA